MTGFLTTILQRKVGEHDSYCVGGPISMSKCDNCAHKQAWELLNDLPDEEFQLHKLGMLRVNEMRCSLSGGMLFIMKYGKR